MAKVCSCGLELKTVEHLDVCIKPLWTPLHPSERTVWGRRWLRVGMWVVYTLNAFLLGCAAVGIYIWHQTGTGRWVLPTALAIYLWIGCLAAVSLTYLILSSEWGPYGPWYNYWGELPLVLVLDLFLIIGWGVVVVFGAVALVIWCYDETHRQLAQPHGPGDDPTNPYQSPSSTINDGPNYPEGYPYGYKA